jgi:hypothetical protein
MITPIPFPYARPPLAARFQPVAAVVPPESPAVEVSHWLVVCVPAINATFDAAATTRLIEQM